MFIDTLNAHPLDPTPYATTHYLPVVYYQLGYIQDRMQTTLATSRLQLFVLKRPLLAAFVSGRAAFSRLIAQSVPDEWPVSPELIPFVLRQFDSVPQIADWLPWAIVDLETESLIGAAGFKGAPDDGGGCEIGYSIIPAFRRRGYATEAVGAILSWARHNPQIRTIRAEAIEGNVGSQGVLEKHGFLPGDVYDHPEDGLTRRYELSFRNEMDVP